LEKKIILFSLIEVLKYATVAGMKRCWIRRLWVTACQRKWNGYQNQHQLV